MLVNISVVVILINSYQMVNKLCNFDGTDIQILSWLCIMIKYSIHIYSITNLILYIYKFKEIVWWLILEIFDLLIYCFCIYLSLLANFQFFIIITWFFYHFQSIIMLFQLFSSSIITIITPLYLIYSFWNLLY